MIRYPNGELTNRIIHTTDDVVLAMINGYVITQPILLMRRLLSIKMVLG